MTTRGLILATLFAALVTMLAVTLVWRTWAPRPASQAPASPVASASAVPSPALDEGAKPQADDADREEEASETPLPESEADVIPPTDEGGEGDGERDDATPPAPPATTPAVPPAGAPGQPTPDPRSSPPPRR